MSTGYPNADIATADAVTNPVANTNYSGTGMSAWVTAGTWYCAVVRVKSATYTSGSSNILSSASRNYNGGFSYPFNVGGAIFNVGSSTKDPNPSCVLVKYSSLGWVRSPYYSPHWGYNNINVSTSGNCVGNKFTLRRPVRLRGYIVCADNENASVGIYAGSNNTALDGTEINMSAYASLRSNTALNTNVAMLNAPVVLNPGTYRVAMKNNSATTNSDGYTLNSPAGTNVLVAGDGDVKYTAYATSSWTDTNDRLAGVSPIIDGFADDAPMPGFAIGI